MTRTRLKEVYSIEWVCNNCERTQRAYADEATDAPPPGWVSMADPIGQEDVQFHSQRCALGYMREAVLIAWRTQQPPEADEGEA